jgi:hypothetical protein
MAVRSTMLPLIKRVRTLINDPSSTTFDDQTIQDVLDESRIDMYNVRLQPQLTFAPTIQFLDYFSDLGGWEEDYVFKQYLTVQVTPSVLEPIAGHFHFSQPTFPPVYITGKIYDIYRAAADLLERLKMQYALQFGFSSDGQSFQRQQIVPNIDLVIKGYRKQQRPGSIQMTRSDLNGQGNQPSLGASVVDYIATGDN